MSEPRPPVFDSPDVAQHLDDLAEQRRTLRNKRVRERHALRMESDPAYRERRQAKQRARYKADPARKRQYMQRRYHALDTPARLIRAARARARDKDIPFDLTIGYVRQLWPSDGRCPVLGFRMVLDKERDETPTLDRIDPARGYVKGNVRIISMRANRLKSDADAFELRRLLEYVESPDPLTHTFRWENMK